MSITSAERMTQATAMSIVASVISDHLFMEASAFPSFPDERSDYAQDNMSYEDYRDATEGRCGFPWETEDEVAGDTERQLNNHLATIAIRMVFALTQADWDEPTDWQEWLPFLTKCVGEKHAKEFLKSSILTDGTWALY